MDTNKYFCYLGVFNAQNMGEFRKNVWCLELFVLTL